MPFRCTPGDLAIVIRDTAACTQNLGRIVEVRGPVEWNRALGLACWLVKPVRRQPYGVELGHLVTFQKVYWRSKVEHPDAWLLPISPRWQDWTMTMEDTVRGLDLQVALRRKVELRGCLRVQADSDFSGRTRTSAS